MEVFIVRIGYGMKATARREAARANGRGYVSEKACFEDNHVQSGTDLVGRRTPNFPPTL